MNDVDFGRRGTWNVTFEHSCPQYSLNFAMRICLSHGWSFQENHLIFQNSAIISKAKYEMKWLLIMKKIIAIKGKLTLCYIMFDCVKYDKLKGINFNNNQSGAFIKGWWNFRIKCEVRAKKSKITVVRSRIIFQWFGKKVNTSIKFNNIIKDKRYLNAVSCYSWV